ncbi:MAG: TIGR02678 family protein [Phycisphaeraceae bacterium]
MSGPRLGAHLDATVRHERQQALRALLSRPLITASRHPEALTLIRRHAEWLREWLARNVQWRLYVDSEVARLRKRPADRDDATRPGIDPHSRVPFTRRRYVMFCLVLAALERAERQTVLGHIARDVMDFAESDPALAEAGVELDLNRHEQRRDLVQVIRLLDDLGVLVRIDGEEEQYVADKGDVLYTIHRVALSSLINVSRGPSTIEEAYLLDRIDAMLNEAIPDSDDARNRRIRAALTARMLDDPVIYYDELSEAERAYLTTQRPHILREVEEATGLVPEVRREGIALADTNGDATDLGMPEEGTAGHLTLLLAEWLAGQAQDAAGKSSALVGIAAVRDQTARLIQTYGLYWRKDARVPGAEVALTEQTLDRLEALRLVRRTEDGVIVRPAIGRYALDAPRQAERAEPTPQLWEQTS